VKRKGHAIMRKLKLFCLCGLTAAVLMTGCAGSTDSNVNLGSATVSEYRGVKINVAAPEVTDDEVDQKIQTNLNQNPNEVEVDRAAAEGDIVNIDYKGTKDGEAFDGGTAEGQDLTLGSGSMIDGFEDGLIGTKKGETKTLDLTFPEDYREESLAGQAVQFEVTVNSVKEKQDAVLDDAFVQRTSDYQTVDEYKAGIRADLLAQKQKTADQEMEQDVLQDVIDNSEFKFSRNGLSVRYNQMLKQYTNQAKMYGMTLSQMAQANGMDEAGFKEYIYSSVKEAAKQEIVVKDIAAKEGLDNITDEDTEAFAQANGMTKDTLVSLYGEDTVKEQVLQDKVLRFLASNADNEAENPAKLSEREVTVTATETAAEETSAAEESSAAEETSTAEETSAEETSEAAESTEAETTTEETKAN
jgi:trigger factor